MLEKTRSGESSESSQGSLPLTPRNTKSASSSEHSDSSSAKSPIEAETPSKPPAPLSAISKPSELPTPTITIGDEGKENLQDFQPIQMSPLPPSQSEVNSRQKIGALNDDKVTSEVQDNTDKVTQGASGEDDRKAKNGSKSTLLSSNYTSSAVKSFKDSHNEDSKDEEMVNDKERMEADEESAKAQESAEMLSSSELSSDDDDDDHMGHRDDVSTDESAPLYLFLSSTPYRSLIHPASYFLLFIASPCFISVPPES